MKEKTNHQEKRKAMTGGGKGQQVKEKDGGTGRQHRQTEEGRKVKQKKNETEDFQTKRKVKTGGGRRKGLGETGKEERDD